MLLNASLFAVFREAKKDPDFKPPPKMRTPMTKHTNQKYCEYHRDHGHWTEECLSLKKEIETIIRRGKLKEFVAQNKDVWSYSWEKGKEKPRTADAFIGRTLEVLKGFHVDKKVPN
jgi:hypothetical protein